MYINLSNEEAAVYSLFNDAHDVEVTLPTPVRLYSSWEVTLDSMM